MAEERKKMPVCKHRENSDMFTALLVAVYASWAMSLILGGDWPKWIGFAWAAFWGLSGFLVALSSDDQRRICRKHGEDNC